MKSELALNNLRIDTLAYNPDTHAFIIIEYKKSQNFSVIDQGYAYLSLLLNNQADFILEYNQILNRNLSKKSVDWSQSRVIFVSPKFTRYQQQATNFQDLPFELWEIRQYENDVEALSTELKKDPIQLRNFLNNLEIKRFIDIDRFNKTYKVREGLKQLI